MRVVVRDLWPLKTLMASPMIPSTAASSITISSACHRRARLMRPSKRKRYQVQSMRKAPGGGGRPDVGRDGRRVGSTPYQTRHPEVRAARRDAPCGEPRRMNGRDAAGSRAAALRGPLKERHLRVTVIDLRAQCEFSPAAAR